MHEYSKKGPLALFVSPVERENAVGFFVKISFLLNQVNRNVGAPLVASVEVISHSLPFFCVNSYLSKAIFRVLRFIYDNVASEILDGDINIFEELSLLVLLVPFLHFLF